MVFLWSFWLVFGSRQSVGRGCCHLPLKGHDDRLGSIGMDSPSLLPQSPSLRSEYPEKQNTDKI